MNWWTIFFKRWNTIIKWKKLQNVSYNKINLYLKKYYYNSQIIYFVLKETKQKHNLGVR